MVNTLAVFTDFLVDHLKDTIGRPWAVQAQREGKSHPLFNWLATMSEIASASRRPGVAVFQSACKGHLGAIWRLGYALYLIQHNDTLDHRLIRRLRAPLSFFPAYHETQIASAFATAGFKIRMAETRRTNHPTPEFWATRESSERYAVEAKCKSGWKSNLDINDDDFRSELRQWVRDQIYASSRKNLANPVFCFELSLPADWDEDQWAELAILIRRCIKEAESIKIAGVNPGAAYIMITNNVDVILDQEFDINRVAMLFGFCMSNWFDTGDQVEIEIAFDSHDTHRDIHAIFRCLEEFDEIPQSFDGVPTLLDARGNEQPIQIRIGSKIEYQADNGASQVGTVYDVCSTGEVLFASVESNGQHHIVKVPLLPHEIEAAKRYGDAVFGKAEPKKRDLSDDPMQFYDWILGVYQEYDQKALLIQIGQHSRREEFAALQLDQLRIRAAREVTKAMIHNINNRKKDQSVEVSRSDLKSANS